MSSPLAGKFEAMPKTYRDADSARFVIAAGLYISNLAPPLDLVLEAHRSCRNKHDPAHARLVHFKNAFDK